MSITLNGITYIGTYREQDGQLVVNSAYGSSDVPIRWIMTDLKEAARLVLTNIVTRGR